MDQLKLEYIIGKVNCFSKRILIKILLKFLNNSVIIYIRRQEK